MQTSSRTRRALAAAASGSLAAGLAWLPADPAAAGPGVPTVPQLQATASAGVSSDCALSSGHPSAGSTIATVKRGTKSRSVDLHASFAATLDSTDTVKASGHYEGSLTVKKNGKHLARTLLTGTGSVSVHSSKGKNSVCDASASVQAGGIVPFSEGSAGWLYVQRSTVSKPGLAQLVVFGNTLSGTPTVFELYSGGASKASSRGFVKAGDHIAIMEIGLVAGGQSAGLKAAPHSSMSIVFHKRGSALGGAQGAGKSYVELPGSVSCGRHKATLHWRPSASKVASAAIFVNGKKKATASTPLGGQKVVLKHLNARADIKITAKLALKGGARALVSRSYVPCKA